MVCLFHSSERLAGFAFRQENFDLCKCRLIVKPSATCRKESDQHRNYGLSMGVTLRPQFKSRAPAGVLHTDGTGA